MSGSRLALTWRSGLVVQRDGLGWLGAAGSRTSASCGTAGGKTPLDPRRPGPPGPLVGQSRRAAMRIDTACYDASV